MPVCRRKLVKVSHGHALYCIDQGPADATSAALFLHGGPGGQTPQHLIDIIPKNYRAVGFDQRGCGRSRPERSITENTTWHTLKDIEQIRHELGIQAFKIIAGSWGAALALLYAASNPGRVEKLILYSPFLGSPKDTEHFLFATRKEYPSDWGRFFHQNEILDSKSLIEQFSSAILGSPSPEQSAACQAWVEYELFAGSNGKETKIDRSLILSGFHLRYAAISCHYFRNGFFLNGYDLLDLTNRVQAPTVILQGGRDLVSRPETAVQLAQDLPVAELRLLHEAGHCGGGSPIEEALLAVLADEFKQNEEA
mgnify:CR=1 FL=1